jgi:hypothetical protein
MILLLALAKVIPALVKKSTGLVLEVDIPAVLFV